MNKDIEAEEFLVEDFMEDVSRIRDVVAPFHWRLDPADLQDIFKEYITKAKEEERREAYQEVMDWAMENGITDKKSFCALRDFLHEKVLTPKE